jgi:alkylation response protein AidB-like acyl-CoA dehydrogenase
MDFALSEGQQELGACVRAFARKELGEAADKGRARDRDGTFDFDGLRKCADFGLLGLPLPERYGGSDRGIVDCVVAMQSLGRSTSDAGLAFAIASHVFTCAIPILLFGSDAQRERYLPSMTRGERIGCHAMSESGAGSDAFDLTTRARREDGGWRLSGSKAFVSNAPIASLALVFARSSEARGWAGVSAFLVELDQPGVSVGKPLDKLGLRTAPTAELAFEEVLLPEDALLGHVGQGATIFQAEMEWERSCLFAAHLGAMQRQLDECVSYAKERHQFGKPIGAFQAISHRIADMRVRIELAELALYKVAWIKSLGRRAPLEAAIAKLVVSEGFLASSLDAVQIHGGYGFVRDGGVERDLRDAVGSRLYSGTNEIQRNVIARYLGL